MVSAGGAATPHGLGSLNEMAPLPRNRPQGIGFAPCATLFRNPGKWMRNLQKSDRGGVYGIVERDSGVATVECDSHTNGGSSGSSGRMRRSFRRSSSAGSGRSFRSNGGRFRRSSSIFASRA